MTFRLLFVWITLLVCHSALAQKPIVRSIDKNIGADGSKITIHGNGFGTDASKLSVFFGATAGQILLATDQLLEVKVPAGATYDNISVTNKSATVELTGYSREQFLLSFGGEHGFDLTDVEGPQKNFAAETGLYDLCMCDFNGDGKIDIAAANNSASTVSVFTNTTASPGLSNITFTKSSESIGVGSLQIKCGDLNGDGRKDIVVSEKGPASISDRIFILENTGAGFSVLPAIKLTGKTVKQIEIVDLDLDGKPEIVVTNQKVEAQANFAILVNTSTTAAISFSPSILTKTIPASTSGTDALAVKDLNDDNLPDIVVSQFQTSLSNIYVVKNASTPGNIAFSETTTLTVATAVANVKIADLDTDNKPEIVASLLISSSLRIFRNQTSGGSISFTAVAPDLVTDTSPWGLDIGDLDGDGKPDIITASATKKSLTVLNNNSTPGTFSFTNVIIPTVNFNRHVNLGDLDGDAKPDIAFTSLNDVSIFRNRNCFEPKVTPEGPLAVCSSFPLELSANFSKSVTYTWAVDGAPQAPGTDPTFDVSMLGTHTYSVTTTGDGCSNTSNVVTVTVSAGTAGDPTFESPTGPICIGGTLNLKVTNEGYTYKWSGPSGYTGTGATPPAITNFQRQHSGKYIVDITVGSCVAKQASIVVEAVDVPDFTVQASSRVACPPANITLSVSPVDVNYTYTWFETTSGNTGFSGTNFTPATSGEYFYKANNPSCGINKESSRLEITYATPPVAAFNAPAEACMGQNVTFDNQSITDNDTEAFYTWDFGDGNSSEEEEPTHKFATAATRTVELTVSYKDGACAASTTKSILIKSAPVVNITNPDNTYIFCPGDSLKLEVLGTFLSYEWNTGATTPSIIVKEGGVYSVDVETTGCTLNAVRDIEQYPETKVEIAAEPASIEEGSTSQLSASGLANYLWSPGETLSDASIANPVASPIETTIYTVTGEDNNGCKAEGSIKIEVRGEPIVNKLLPANFFSPNTTDAVNPTWSVGKIEEYPQCNIAIYDDKGIKVFEAKPYLNDWDGTFKGKQLPDGVYFYVIRCDGEENNPRTGSITILR